MKQNHPSTDSPISIGTEDTVPAASILGWDWKRKIAGPFGLTCVSNLLLWLAFPPVGLFWLAWVAPAPMLLLVISPSWQYRRPLWKVWWTSLMFWLATFYFIPFPHPILIVGWFALSAYLAIYTPLTLVVARTLIWRWKIPAMVAVPVAWTGLEWIRMNFLTGFGMVGLSHSQYANPMMIQIADLSGAYTVTFAMTAFATACALAIPVDRNTRKRWVGGLGSVLVLGLVAGYGAVRLSQQDKTNNRDNVTVALIQTSIDTILAQKTESQVLDELKHLREINWAARRADDSIDLIVWPESSYPYGNYISDDRRNESALISQANLKEMWAELTHGSGRFTAVPGIIGTSTIDVDNKQVFNSAVLVDDQGKPVGRYDKHHRVMFGEYIPVIEYFPAVMKVLPFARNVLTPGEKAELMVSGNLKIAANVCFESTVPHLIRHQLNSIATQKYEPDVLLNITNDGWFFGTSCLDLHYACNVFRAVELRKPVLVCANTGLSAHIDPWGVPKQKTQRRKAEYVICKICPDAVYPQSQYRKIGDCVPILMANICVLTLMTLIVTQRRIRHW